MNQPPRRPEFVPAWSPDFVLGHGFLYYAIAAVSEAFMAKAKPAPR